MLFIVSQFVLFRCQALARRDDCFPLVRRPEPPLFTPALVEQARLLVLTENERRSQLTEPPHDYDEPLLHAAAYRILVLQLPCLEPAYHAKLVPGW